MSTTLAVAALFQLQQLDLELDRLNAEVQSLETALRSNTHLQRLRSEHGATQQQLQVSRQAQQEAEWALADINRRLKAQEQRMYDGIVTNPRELQALQQEVQRIRGQQSRQEHIVQQALDHNELLQEQSERQAATMREAEVTWEQESAQLVSRREQAETRKQALQTQRAQMIGSIDATILQRYEILRRTKQGRAISKVEKNSCQWCRVILTPSELQRVRTGSQLQTCTNCGRILYYDR